VPTRTPEEIRASIEQNRLELGSSLEKLRGEVEQLTDWRSQLRSHQQQVTVGAGAAGFVLGGGIAALGSLLFGRRARKERRLAAREAG
jgi:dienelactone hydrolase